MQKMVSADSHVVEPADLWKRLVAPTFRDRAPQVVRDARGEDVFVCDGATLLAPGRLCMAGRTGTDRARPTTMEDVYPGAYDPTVRLKDMALDGVEGEVLYPSVAMRLFALPDLQLKRACLEAYNTWIAEFCGTYPDRFKGIGMIGIDDVESAVAELHRVRSLGLAGVMITIGSDDPALYSNEALDPFWASAQELRLPVGLHVSTGQKPLQLRTQTDETLNGVMEVQRSLANMIFGGLFYRFPQLKVVSVENDAGWAGYFVQRMDYLFNNESRRATRDYAIKDNGMLPSEYFRRNVGLTFIRHSTDVEMRRWVGVDNLMWSSDYPHDRSTWPNSRDLLDGLFQGVPEDERRLLARDNARRLYGFA